MSTVKDEMTFLMSRIQKMRSNDREAKGEVMSAYALPEFNLWINSDDAKFILDKYRNKANPERIDLFNAIGWLKLRMDEGCKAMMDFYYRSEGNDLWENPSGVFELDE